MAYLRYTSGRLYCQVATRSVFSIVRGFASSGAALLNRPLAAFPQVVLLVLRILRPRTVHAMRPLRYSINVTLDGCVDHQAGLPDDEQHRYWAENLAQADALLFGRVTYEMMESAWRPSATGVMPDWMADWMEPFARSINAAKKYVVSSTLDRADWNSELVRGDLGKAVQQLKSEQGKGLLVGGVTLPLALAELGLIDEYEFVVQPRIAGHGPTLLAGLSKPLDLRLVSRLELSSGAVVTRYPPRR